MANNKKIKNISADKFDELLAIGGYIYPRTDKELEQFESLYENYDFELNGIRVNPEKIIKNNFEKKGKVIKIQDKEEQQDINEIKLVARKGNEKIPQSILDKMKRKHKGGDEQS